ncbi:cardioacceleratory peptide receptor-like [Tubulanus polymorphus]|uniref:cardioacceleratory peptide receptor-like n=1 Tax=Tubulanus polymorphus TaxID=672921 RepID=UPI003DA2E17B
MTTIVEGVDTTTMIPTGTDSNLNYGITEIFNSTLSGNDSLNDSNATKRPGVEFYQTAQVTFLFILFILIVIGNSTVLIALSAQKSTRRSRMNIFIMNLALADMANGFFNVLPDAIWRITVIWYAGSVGCKIFKYLQFVVTYASTYALVALSLDRLDAIARPLSFSGYWLRAKILIGLCWGCSFLFSIPGLIFYNDVQLPDGTPSCWMLLALPVHWKIYIMLIGVGIFIIPTGIITMCYTIIIFIVWGKSQTLSTGTCSKRRKTTRSNGSSDVSPVDQESNRASSRGIIPQAKIRTIKMTLIIVIVFVLCWSPYFVFDFLDVYGHIPQSQVKLKITIFVQSLAPLNSAVNPLIYGIFSTRICRNLRRIELCDRILRMICCCCPCMKQPLQPYRQATNCSSTVVTDFSVTEDGEVKSKIKHVHESQRRLVAPPYGRDGYQVRPERRSLIRANMAVEDDPITIGKQMETIA